MASRLLLLELLSFSRAALHPGFSPPRLNAVH